MKKACLFWVLVVLIFNAMPAMAQDYGPPDINELSKRLFAVMAKRDAFIPDKSELNCPGVSLAIAHKKSGAIVNANGPCPVIRQDDGTIRCITPEEMLSMAEEAFTGIGYEIIEFKMGDFEIPYGEPCF